MNVSNSIMVFCSVVRLSHRFLGGINSPEEVTKENNQLGEKIFKQVVMRYSSESTSVR